MTTRIVPHVSRRAAASFWRVQELGAYGWFDWSGLFPTKYFAAMSIAAEGARRG